MSIDPSEMKSSAAAEAADPNARMKELVALLNKASEAYYAKDRGNHDQFRVRQAL